MGNTFVHYNQNVFSALLMKLNVIGTSATAEHGPF
jgi:hypothetical protein